MASIEKRIAGNKTTYRVKVRLKGYPTQTATFDRLTDAKKWTTATESAIREGRHFKTAESKKHTLADLVERYIKDTLPTKSKTQQNIQKQQLERWSEEIGSYLLADITPALIVECRDKLLREKTLRGIRSPATVVRYMSALSHAFTIAVNEWGWIDDSPMRKVKKPKEPRGRVRYLLEEERPVLLNACRKSSNDWLYTIVILAISTGMRYGEIMKLQWQDINLKDSYLILHDTKNGERRRVPIVGVARSLLEQHAKIRRLDTNLLFPSNKNPDKPIDIRKPWATALKQTDIKDFRFHDLRHSAASYLAMNGASLAEIAEILGHKTLQMVKRYAHLSDGHISHVVADMNNKILG